MVDLTGKVVAITGASRGIGAGIASECMARGMKVALCARTRPEHADSANLLSMTADVTNEEAVESFAQAAIKAFGSIDLWINNAGILKPIAPLRKCSSNDVLAHLQVNIMGVFHGTKSFSNHVHNRDGGGVLINISSGAATSAYEGWGPYCAGKAAVDRLTEVVALEEAEHGLRAHAVAPGIIDTEMQSLIRSCEASDFPAVEKFRDLKKEDAFSSLDFVAKRLLEVAFDPAHRPDEVCLRLPSGK